MSMWLTNKTNETLCVGDINSFHTVEWYTDRLCVTKPAYNSNRTIDAVHTVFTTSLNYHIDEEKTYGNDKLAYITKVANRNIKGPLAGWSKMKLKINT